jgi:hypothetical protein
LFKEIHKAAGNTTDAIQKLTDFRAKVTQLDEQAKISHPDTVTLITGADQAIACIQSIGTSKFPAKDLTKRVSR